MRVGTDAQGPYILFISAKVRGRGVGIGVGDGTIVGVGMIVGVGVLDGMGGFGKVIGRKLVTGVERSVVELACLW